FLQAKDGIRDFHVTGVQTCALPISACVHSSPGEMAWIAMRPQVSSRWKLNQTTLSPARAAIAASPLSRTRSASSIATANYLPGRSEERRVWKQIRARE